MSSKKIHRLTAVILGLFIISHLAVHLTAWVGIEAHLKTLNAIQWVYRNPIGEGLLVITIITQIVTGIKRLKAKRRNKSKWVKAQMYSGLYLIAFMTIHTSAAIYTHSIFGVETDFYWAAGSVTLSPIKFVFWPYYFIAILSFFVHAACALHFGWPGRFQTAKKTLPAFGSLLAIAILIPFSGALYDILIPKDVMGYYAKYFGFLGIS